MKLINLFIDSVNKALEMNSIKTNLGYDAANPNDLDEIKKRLRLQINLRSVEIDILNDALSKVDEIKRHNDSTPQLVKPLSKSQLSKKFLKAIE